LGLCSFIAAEEIEVRDVQFSYDTVISHFTVLCRVVVTVTLLITWIIIVMMSVSVNEACSPFPQIDIIGVVVIVWRVRGKLSGLFCAILCATIVHSEMHTHINKQFCGLGFVSLGPFHCA